MPVNNRGVYVYAETDADAKASDMLNRATSALTDANTEKISDALSLTGPLPGWKRDSGTLLRMGLFRQLRLEVTRDGADISVPAHGNITNTVVGTLLQSRDYPALECPISTGAGGRVVAGYVHATSGDIVLSAVGGSGSLPKGETIVILASWIATQV